MKLRIPWFSLALLPVLIGLEVATEVHPLWYPAVQRQMALNWEGFRHFELWRLVTSPLLQDRDGFAGGLMWLVIALVPPLELRARTAFVATVFYLGDWLSTVPVLIGLRVAAAFGNAAAERLAFRADSGSSSGAFACAAALALTVPGRWRVPGLLAIFGFLACRLALYHRLDDVQHTLAALVGLNLAWACVPRAPSGLSGLTFFKRTGR